MELFPSIFVCRLMLEERGFILIHRGAFITIVSKRVAFQVLTKRFPVLEAPLALGALVLFACLLHFQPLLLHLLFLNSFNSIVQ